MNSDATKVAMIAGHLTRNAMSYCIGSFGKKYCTNVIVNAGSVRARSALCLYCVGLLCGMDYYRQDLLFDGISVVGPKSAGSVTCRGLHCMKMVHFATDHQQGSPSLATGRIRYPYRDTERGLR
jgi:hypothetical protein